MESEITPGLVPIWFADNKDKVTTSFFMEELKEYGLATGTRKSNCQMPCSTMHVDSRSLSVEDGEETAIALFFSDNVLVTKTQFIKFNFLMFLSDIGGSMGLWLGLGLLQALRISINFAISWTGRNNS